jgi:hypothetical protein
MSIIHAIYPETLILRRQPTISSTSNIRSRPFIAKRATSSFALTITVSCMRAILFSTIQISSRRFTSVRSMTHMIVVESILTGDSRMVRSMRNEHTASSDSIWQVIPGRIHRVGSWAMDIGYRHTLTSRVVIILHEFSRAIEMWQSRERNVFWKAWQRVPMSVTWRSANRRRRRWRQR